MNSLLAQFTYLQLLDMMTTLAFLAVGVQEANPVVRAAFGLTDTPLAGLLLVKSMALMLGVYCWRHGRQGLLARVNVLFAALVAWNLLALIVGAQGKGL